MRLGKRDIYRIGSRRTIEKFLFFPKRLQIGDFDNLQVETRWLEKAKIVQVYTIIGGREAWDDLYFFD